MTSWLLGAPGSTSCNIDEHNLETMLPEGIDQHVGALDDIEIGWIESMLTMPF
jgi:hypothetical protein